MSLLSTTFNYNFSGQSKTGSESNIRAGSGRFKKPQKLQRPSSYTERESLLSISSIILSPSRALQEWNDSIIESMIQTSRILLFLLWFLASQTPPLNGESSTCLMVYKEGGAPAVFQSPKCPSWRLSNDASRPRTVTCQSAMSQGRRKSQEDRTFCALDVRIPFPRKTVVIDALGWIFYYVLIGCQENIGKGKTRNWNLSLS